MAGTKVIASQQLHNCNIAAMLGYFRFSSEHLVARSKKTLTALFEPSRSKMSSSRKRLAAEENPALQAFWHAVCAIPRGQVSTYGAVARAAGFPGRARQAGFALRVGPKALNLPWHRVVGAGGRIVFPKSSAEHKEQARRLRAEGVSVQNGHVSRFNMTRVDDL
jgi:methylated-DNA-protein-cysteine methyltransferase-like protein